MTEQIGDRHLRKVAGLGLASTEAGSSVRVLIPREWAETRSGQLLASCLVNLLCRQDGVIARIVVECDNVQCLVPLPNGQHSSEFPAMLQALAKWAVGPAFIITTEEDPRETDYTVVVGSPAPSVTAGTAIGVIGFGWRAWVGDLAAMPALPASALQNPIGPFLGAALVAGEIFMSARGRTRGARLAGNAYSLWSGKSGPDLVALTDGPELRGRGLPPFHMIGAGAVGNDLAYLLANAQLAASEISTMDDDSYDATSLNRCLVAGHEDAGDPKILAVRAVLQAAGHDTYGFRGTLAGYLGDVREGLGPQLAAETNDVKYGVVVSCVDRGGVAPDNSKIEAAPFAGWKYIKFDGKS